MSDELVWDPEWNCGPTEPDTWDLDVRVTTVEGEVVKLKNKVKKLETNRGKLWGEFVEFRSEVSRVLEHPDIQNVLKNLKISSKFT